MAATVRATRSASVLACSTWYSPWRRLSETSVHSWRLRRLISAPASPAAPMYWPSRFQSWVRVESAIHASCWYSLLYISLCSHHVMAPGAM